MSILKTEKKTVSATQIQSFLQYPRQFEKRYIQHVKEPASGRMILGKAWHRGIEENYRQKLTSGKDLPLAAVQEIFATAFEDAIRTEEIVFAPGESAESIRTEGLAITAVYHQTIAPKVQPLLVEEPFRVSLGEDFPYELTGYWDLIAVPGTIIDHKAHAKPPTQGDVDRHVQLTVYALAYRLAKGQMEKGLRLDVVVKAKEPYAIQIPTTRTNADCQWVLGVIERMVQTLEAATKTNGGAK